MDPKDIEQLKATNIIGTDNPLALQRLVWLGVALHYARRGRENYRSMTKSTFVINTGSDGRRFMEMAYCEKTKNHQADKASNSYKPQGRIYEQPGDNYCILSAYELYLSLLNVDDCLWQRPNMQFNKTGNWYHRQVLGKHMLGEMLKKMCKDAGISSVYTNHCTRVTKSVLLNEARFGENNIVHVTGHKNTNSLGHYINKASHVEKKTENG